MAKPFESRIQDLVYNVDVGIGLRLIKISLYVLFVMIIMLLFTVMQFKGLRDAEAMDYAQLGRNLMRSGRLITQCVRPASMWYMIEKSHYHNPKIMQHPDIMHPPLYPTLLAGGFKVMQIPFPTAARARVYPAERWAIIPINHFFALMTGLLVFLLGRYLFDNRIAWLGMTVYYLSETVWRDSISGLGISIITFLAVSVFYTILLAAGRARENDARPRQWLLWYLLAALACILAFLTRYAAGVLIPATALFIGLSFRKRSWMWAGLFVVVCLLGITPWLIRNVWVSGGLLGLAPYTAVENTGMFSGDTFERTLAPTLHIKSTISALRTKWMTGMARFYREDLFSIGDGLLMCLFAASLFYRFVRQRVQLLRWSVVLGIVLIGCIGAIYGSFTLRLLHIFWPFIILYGMAFFFLLLDRLQLKVRILNISLIGLMILLSALPLVFALLPPRAGTPYPPYFPPFIMHVCNMLEPDELLCTDMPWATAWYGQRTSLLLPVTLDEFYAINDYNKRISGLYFTTLTRNKPYVRQLYRGPYETWFPILEGRIPATFPLSQGFPIGNMDQLFLTDRARWAE
jgi:4-amino-4-deoxy-L-arabinose transferase-like glycosyltransferase